MIKKLWQKIKEFFLELKIKRIEAELWDEASSNIDMNTAYDPISIVQEDREQKYFNGLALMKKKIREQTQGYYTIWFCSNRRYGVQTIRIRR